MTDCLFNDGIRGKGEKTLIASECQALISEALVALRLEEPSVVGRAVNQHGPFKMNQGLSGVSSVQFQHAQLNQRFCAIWSQINGLDETLFRLVYLS